MGNGYSRNEFPVLGKTAVITGGSSGMGLAFGRLLAEKGANVVIVARDEEKLKQAVQHLQQGASKSERQRFHYVRADLTIPSESARVLQDVVVWNAGHAPDIVWCCAGRAHPALFIDTSLGQLKEQMDTNYFTSMYMAHATLTCWLKTAKSNAAKSSSSVKQIPSGEARHLILTSSFLALYSIAGYSPYSPCKAALRCLSDTLSQEVKLYAAAHPEEPPIRLHSIFPAAVFTEGHKAQNMIKPDLTKMLEGSAGQTPEAIAKKSIEALERGTEMITTDALSNLVRGSMLGGSVRGSLWAVMRDWFLAWLAGILMVLVRSDMDKKVTIWGRKYGPTGMIEGDPVAST
ncbi:NAD(P)-binding protein [Nemania sp. FL0031]|nr:NAD(P)-binding protein [Nemania sp. FL0031]